MTTTNVLRYLVGAAAGILAYLIGSMPDYTYLFNL